MTTSSGTVSRGAGITLPYRIFGDGTSGRMLFAHAMFASGIDTRQFFDCWLDRGWQVLVMDQRGHGQASPIHIPAQFDLNDMAADLVAVLEAVRWEHAWFGGGSMGAATALVAATLVPDRVDGLALLAPAFGRRPNPAIADFDSIADAYGAGGMAAGLARWRELLLGAGVPPHGAGELLARISTMDPSSFGCGLRAIPRWVTGPALDLLPHLTQPVAVVAWEDDPVHSISVAEEIVASAPHSRLRRFTSADDVNPNTLFELMIELIVPHYR